MSKGTKKPQHRRPPITLILLVVGGVLLLAGAILAWSRSSSIDLNNVEVQGRPSLKVDQQMIDYGDVKLDTPLSFRLTITNIGDQTLRFREEPYVEVVEGC